MTTILLQEPPSRHHTNPSTPTQKKLRTPIRPVASIATGLILFLALTVGLARTLSYGKPKIQQPRFTALQAAYMWDGFHRVAPHRT